MSRQIPSILPQPRGATVTPPPNFKLAFAPADYNPYIFMDRAKTKSWRSMLGTMSFYLDMEGEAPPTLSEAWAALLADQHFADHPTELPPVNDRRLALEVIQRRAHVSRTLWGGTKVHVHSEALPAADVTLLRVIQPPVAPAKPVKATKAAKAPKAPKEQSMGEFVTAVRAENDVLCPKVKPKVLDAPVAVAPPKEESMVAFVDAVRADNKAANNEAMLKKIDATLELIAAARLKHEVDDETKRRMAEAPAKAEWEGF